MADNKNNMSQQPQLCKQGCGFYGNPNFDGMCSKCYKDYVQRKANTTGVLGRASPSMNPSSERALSAAFASAVSSSAPSGLTVDEMRALINSDTSSNESRVHSASVSIDTDAAAGSNAILGDAATAGTASAGDNVEKPTAGGEKAQSTADAGHSARAIAGASKSSNRCAQCQKKVGLTGFACRCGGTFCGDHRYSDRHACQFDYKQRGAEELRKLNPVVVAEKLSKI